MDVTSTLAIAQASISAQAMVGRVGVSMKKAQGLADSGFRHAAQKQGLICDRLGLTALGCPQCGGLDDAVFQNEQEADEDASGLLGPPAKSLTPHKFRLCVFSGEEITSEGTFVEVTFRYRGAPEKSFNSPVSPESGLPVWDFLVETDLEAESLLPTIEIKVMSSRLFGSRVLGSTILPLPSPSDFSQDPQRKWLNVQLKSGMLGMVDKSITSKIQVIWQICDKLEGQPDLSRIGSMPPEATEKKQFRVDVSLFSIRLVHGTHKTMPVTTRLTLCRDSEDGEALELGRQMAQEVKTEQKIGQDASAPVLQRGHTSTELSKGKRFTYASWASKNDRNGYRTKPWDVYDSEVGLMSYSLVIHVWVGVDSERQLLGTWKHTLGNLVHRIREDQRKHHFFAQVSTKDGASTGFLELELDIFDRGKGAHEGSVHSSARSGNAELRVRQTMLPHEFSNKKENLFVSILALNLDEAVSKPYIKVFMGSSVYLSKPLVKRDARFVSFVSQDTIPVQTSYNVRKARIEVWDKRRSMLGDSRDFLIGQAVIYEAEAGQHYWHDLSGGVKEPQFLDAAEAMKKGQLRPSTYHGTIAVHVGRRARMRDDFTQVLLALTKQITLSVRLFRGLYLDMFAGQHVKVLIQLPGATLTSGDRQPQRNVNVLSFPAEVSQDGVLRFKVPEEEAAKESSWMGGLFTSKSSEAVAPVAWVERCTPQAEPLILQPAVSFVYLYIVRDGEEDLPPTVWGRLPLVAEDQQEKATWTQLSYDQSVVELSDKSHRPDDLAGCILGSAVFDFYNADRMWILKGEVDPEQTNNVPGRKAELEAFCKKRFDLKPESVKVVRGGKKAKLTFPSSSDGDAAEISFENWYRNWEKAEKKEALAWFKTLTFTRVLQDDEETTGQMLIEGSDGADDEPADAVAAPTEAQRMSDRSMLSVTQHLTTHQKAHMKEFTTQKEALKPNITKPTSVLCQPITGFSQMNIGSPGELVRWCRETTRKEVWCHVDLLAARSLMSADEDGLSDPCYHLRVEDKTLLNKQTASKSLDPTFMHRIVIGPIVLEVEEPEIQREGMHEAARKHNLSSHVTPALPPILFRLLDRDDTKFGYKFFVQGRVAIMSPSSLDEKALKSTPKSEELKQLDVNEIHKPVWYAFDADSNTPFWAGSSVVDVSWQTRPRVLMAAGFSMLKDIKDIKIAAEEKNKLIYEDKWSKIVPITTELSASYRITIDLLGIRNLPAQSFWSSSQMELMISSFWDKAVMLTSASFHRSANERNVNFQGSQEDDAAKAFKELIRPLAKISNKGTAATTTWFLGSESLSPAASIASSPRSSDVKRGKSALSPAAGRDFGSTAEKPHQVLSIESFLGWRLNAPIYKVPVIPYLQKDHQAEESKLENEEVANSSSEEPIAPVAPVVPCPPSKLSFGKATSRLKNKSKKDQFVLMPDLVFSLRDANSEKQLGTQSHYLPINSNQDFKSVEIMKKAERIREVLYSWTPDESQQASSGVAQLLSVKKGDRIEILHEDESGWSMGIKVLDAEYLSIMAAIGPGSLESAGKEKGWFPHWVISYAAEHWSEKLMEEYETLGDLQRVPELVVVPPFEEMYDMYIDVFAAQDGWLRFNQQFQVGRHLCEQRLFTIDSTLEHDQPNIRLGQVFNPADWILSKPELLDQPFDHRFSPLICCAKITDSGLQSTRMSYGRDESGNMVSELSERHSGPMSKADIFRDWICEFGRGITLEALSTMTTQEIQKMAQDRGYRCMSHQHVPELARHDISEDIVEDTSGRCVLACCSFFGCRRCRRCGAPPPKKEKKQTLRRAATRVIGLEPNLHTFMRPVGHVISSHDRDSRLLAKLRIALPRSAAFDSDLSENHVTYYAGTDERQYRFSMTADGNGIEVKEGDETKLLATDYSEDESVLTFQPGDVELQVPVPDEMVSKVKDLFKLYKDLKEKRKNVKDSTNSFLNVKFNRPGVVIWTAPPEVYAWDEPGSLLFVVKLADSTGYNIPVYVPSFDLRFEHETSWLPVKTLRIRSSDLQRQIRLRGTTTATQDEPPVPQKASETKTNTPVAWLANPSGTQPPDGYSKPIYVSKNAFVCRIKKRPNSYHFDRARTNNWYQTVLSDVNVPVQHLALAGGGRIAHQTMKHFYMTKFMNLRHELQHCVDPTDASSLYGHEDRTFSSTILKGHVVVTSVPDADEEVLQRRPEGKQTQAVREIKDASSGLIEELASPDESRVVSRDAPTEASMQVASSGSAPGSREAPSEASQAAELPPSALSKTPSKKTGQSVKIFGYDVPDPLASFKEKPKPPETDFIPLQNWWVSAGVTARVYILTARGITLDPGTELNKPYVILKTSDGKDQTSNPANAVWLKNADFYFNFCLTLTLPGAGTVDVQLMNTNTVGADTLIGEFALDLEDRWLCLKQNRMRAATSVQYLQRVVSPSKEEACQMPSFSSDPSRKRQWLDPEELPQGKASSKTRGVDNNQLGNAKEKDDSGLTIKPHVPPLPELPIETHLLKAKDDNNPDRVVGAMRLWVDMFSELDVHQEVQLKQSSTQYLQVSITIWHVEGISIFKDFGERNDIYVTGELRCKSPGFALQKVQKRTDTHKFATDTAAWNFKWVFSIPSPTTYCSLNLALVDEDTIGLNDLIYDPKVLPLDHILMAAYEKTAEGKKLDGSWATKVVFDTWPDRVAEEDIEISCIRQILTCGRKRLSGKPATLYLDVNIVALQHGQDVTDEEGQLTSSPPPGRVSWPEFTKRPVKLLKMLLGPKNFRKLRLCLIFWAIGLTLLVILAVIFFLTQGFIVPIIESQKS